MNSGIYRENAAPPIEDVLGLFAAKVYTWMTVMLLATAGASVLAIQMHMVQWYTAHSGWFLITLLAELGLVAVFAGFRKSLNFFTGLFLMSAYTILNGLTLSVVLTRYQPQTVAVAFVTTAGVFALASAYGFIAKRSLESLGGWLALGLLGLLGAMIANLFIGSRPMDYVISCVAVVIFTGLAAYDAQMIQKRGSENPTALTALDCALEVYLDFLNLFLHILRLFGGVQGNKND
jgi:FtsH-binding integral membrane protein